MLLAHAFLRNNFTNQNIVPICNSFCLKPYRIHSFPEFLRSAPLFPLHLQWVCFSICTSVMFFGHNLHSILGSPDLLKDFRCYLPFLSPLWPLCGDWATGCSVGAGGQTGDSTAPKWRIGYGPGWLPWRWKCVNEINCGQGCMAKFLVSKDLLTKFL